jgi:hypothetical protein
VRPGKSQRVSCLSRIEDYRQGAARGVESGVYQDISPAAVGAVSVENAEGFFIVQDPRPGYHFPGP